MFEYEPTFVLATEKYIDECPFDKGKYYKRLTIYRCFCNGYKMNSRTKWIQHIGSNVHKDGLANYNSKITEKIMIHVWFVRGRIQNKKQKL